MKVRITLAVLAATCCLAVAAEDAAKPRTEISNLKSQIPNAEVDAIAIPRMLSYQGKMTDTFGLPVADTLYAIRFRLYAQPTGGTHFWEENQQVRTKGGLFSTLLGSTTPIGSMPDAGAAYVALAVNGGAELTPRLRIGAAAYAYLSERAANADLLEGRDTSYFARAGHSHGFADSANVAANSHRLQGKDTTAFAVAGHNHDATYVNEAQADAITTGMIVNGTIAAADLGQMGAASGQVMKWTGSAWAPRNDSVGGGGGGGTVTSVSQASGVVCTPNPITATGTVGFDQTYGDNRYINEGQSASGDLTGTYPGPSLANSGVTAGTYGSATQVSQVTVDAKGRVTGASNVSISGVPPGGTAGGDLAGTYPNPTVAANAVGSAEVIDASLRGADIALPCTLTSSSASPILRVRATGSGPALYVDTAGNYGIHVRRAAMEAIHVDTVPWWGMRMVYCATGIRMEQTDYQGVIQERAKYSTGFFLNKGGYNGFAVDSAGQDGFVVVNAGRHGFAVYDTAQQHGVHIRRAKQNGVNVEYAGVDGIHVNGAGDDGIEVTGSNFGVYAHNVNFTGVIGNGGSYGGSFSTNLATGIGLEADAYLNNPANTAIVARGKGLASGGWFTGDLAGGKAAPGVVSPERGIMASGSARLAGGTALVWFDPVVTDNIRSDLPVRVTVTPRGPAGGILYVAQSDARQFSVRLEEMPGVAANRDCEFDWIAFATLREPELSAAARADWERTQAEMKRKARPASPGDDTRGNSASGPVR